MRALAFAVFLLSVLPAAASAAPVLHYVRSNSDGSEPETVVQFRPTLRDIMVYKARERCTTAAYVTAHMAEGGRDADLYVAGKVARDGSQARFGTLSLDRSSNSLMLALDVPGEPEKRGAFRLRSRPYVIFDFDFADLNAALQNRPDVPRFTYALPVLWPHQDGFGFKDLGVLTGRFVRAERHKGYRTRRYDLLVTGAQPARGVLWIDERRGFIVEARLGLPNHQEYRDFRLNLVRLDPSGQRGWERLTRDHYRDCPTGK